MLIRHILIGIVFFFIFYFEPVFIGPIKFALLWKVPLLLYLLVKLKFEIFKNKVSIYSFLYYIKYFFSYGVLYFGYIVDGFKMSTKGMSIPILFSYFNSRHIDKKSLIRLLLAVSNFVILSSLPFLFNVLEPISTGYGLGGYGSTEKGFVGIFQNPHAASIIISQSLLVKTFFLSKTSNKRIVNYIIFLIGFYVLYKTYVRTGYVIFFLGLFILFFRTFNWKTLLKFIPILLFFYFAFTQILAKDEILKRRLLQENIYDENYKQGRNIDNISSGRLTISTVNLNNYFEADMLIKTIGMGFQYSADLMEQEINMRLMSHNGFVDALVHNGAIGLIIYLLFLFHLFKTMRINRHSIFYPLALGSFLTFIIFIFVQGGNIFLYELQILLITSIVIRTSNRVKRTKLDK